MAELFSQEWAGDVRNAINSFPDDEYRATKLDMFWDWIKAAREGWSGIWVLGARSNGDARFVALTIEAGECTKAEVVDEPPEDATYVLAGDFDVWKDILGGYDSGKAVMYRRLRLEKGDVFRFFNRIYFFTESLVALSKVPAKLPA